MKVKVTVSATTWWRALWLVVFLLATALRLLRLSWQPLWWDEGYSVYFATEPISRMFWLTAQDIHPPLYYLLLHLWFNLLGNSGPETARLFSVMIALSTLPLMTWTALTLWPKQRWLALLATLYLAVSPFHLYYSQEVRMYGLALLLTLASSTFLWLVQQRLEEGERPFSLVIGYILTASLALLTLYYCGLVLLAHQLWTLTVNSRHWRRQIWFVVAAIFIILIQLPWWLYAFPKLFAYIGNKVLSDQDLSLPLWSYLWRHWLAFFTGHLPALQSGIEIARQIVVALIAVALGIGIALTKLKGETRQYRWLLFMLLIPFLVAFAVNLVYPFFPDGGERLLLEILPYLLLFVTALVVKLSTNHRWLSAILLTLPLIAAAVGIYIFFATPRYADHDYRPIIAEITTKSRPNDTVLALFPWQVGYWRAYSPRTTSGELLPPQPSAIDQTILRWDDTFSFRLDAALQQGALWFPMPESFGSTLPEQIESYLKAHARNLENHWYSPATRLSAWVQTKDSPVLVAINADYPAQVTLVSAGVAPTTVASANSTLAIDLCWLPTSVRSDLRATLRLLDNNGFIWSKRDLTPLAAFAGQNTGNPCLESIGMEIPVGVPPGTYQLAIGVAPAQSDQLLTPVTAASPLVTLADIQVTAPEQPISPERLAMQFRLSTPVSDGGLLLLGYDGPGNDAQLLSGDEVAMSLFLQNTVTHPPTRDLFVALLDGRQNDVASWQGWPLPSYPTNSWAVGALTQAPIRFDLPPELPAGNYSLVAGFADPANKAKPSTGTLTHVRIVRRPATFSPPSVMTSITPMVTFGSHANLAGYSISQSGDIFQLELTWQITQPLLPPHHIFVHLLDANGKIISQSDGEPTTVRGRAPTGSWLPGEFLTTEHSLAIPANAQQPLTIETGLYLPSTSRRLPAAVDGVSIGDSAVISLTQIITP